MGQDLTEDQIKGIQMAWIKALPGSPAGQPPALPPPPPGADGMSRRLLFRAATQPRSTCPPHLLLPLCPPTDRNKMLARRMKQCSAAAGDPWAYDIFKQDARDFM
jgi:hypothetical protein